MEQIPNSMEILQGNNSIVLLSKIYQHQELNTQLCNLLQAWMTELLQLHHATVTRYEHKVYKVCYFSAMPKLSVGVCWCSIWMPSTIPTLFPQPPPLPTKPPSTAHHHHQWLPPIVSDPQPWQHDKNDMATPHKQVNRHPQDVGNVTMTMWHHHLTVTMHNIITVQTRWVCPSLSPLPFFDTESRCHVTNSDVATKQWMTMALSFIVVLFMTSWWPSPLPTHLTWPTNRQQHNPVTTLNLAMAI